MATHIWTEAEDALLREFMKKPRTRSEAKALRLKLGVTRHALRGRIGFFRAKDKQGDAPRSKGMRPAGAEADPTDARIIMLQAEVQTLRSQLQGVRRQNNVLLENTAIISAMKEELRQTLAPLAVLPPAASRPLRANKAPIIEEDVVMHLSDEHGDQTVEPHRVLGLETYNLRIALARAERYVKTVLEYTQETLSNYRFPRLWLFCYGDHVNGEIHDATNHSAYFNAMRNALAVGQMRALMLRDLAPYFKDIRVICVPGNHGRRTPKIDLRGAWNNWDYLVAESASLLCRDLKNVEFTIPDAYSINVSIRGYTFNINHGHMIKSWNSIPYYGIERRNRRLSATYNVAGQKIDYYCLGHFHSLSSIPSPGGETLINGSWKTTDEFSLEQQGEAAKPMQWLHGVHENYGITWRLPVYLKAAGEAQGPQRYKIRLADFTGAVKAE